MSFFTKQRMFSIAVMAWIALAPIRPAMACAFLLPLADLILALVCAIRAKRPVTSAGLKRSIGKIFLYEAATLLAFMAETYLTGGTVPAIKLVTGLIGVTELKSCLEHLDEIGGAPVFATVLTKLAPPQPPDNSEPKQ